MLELSAEVVQPVSFYWHFHVLDNGGIDTLPDDVSDNPVELLTLEIH